MSEIRKSPLTPDEINAVVMAAQSQEDSLLSQIGTAPSVRDRELLEGTHNAVRSFRMGMQAALGLTPTEGVLQMLVDRALRPVPHNIARSGGKSEEEV